MIFKQKKTFSCKHKVQTVLFFQLRISVGDSVTFYVAVLLLAKILLHSFYCTGRSRESSGELCGSQKGISQSENILSKLKSSLFCHLTCGKNVDLYYSDRTSRAPFQNQYSETSVQMACSICSSTSKRKTSSIETDVAICLLP